MKFCKRFAQLRTASLAACLCVAPLASAAQLDIAAPAGSVSFGARVAVLDNGNIVVVDPDATVSGVSNAGAIYLYSSSGTLISAATGSTADDHVGRGGIFVLRKGNAVVASPDWHNGAAQQAGAATWIDGVAGLSAPISAANSLVGTTAGDQVGFLGVVVLANGNYVVNNGYWHESPGGAATWGDGKTGVSGAVSAANSLVGAFNGCLIVELSNGNYVVAAPYWNGAVGAVTWGDGAHGVSGPISAANSLLGSATGDEVGFAVTPLANGNYVVASPYWSGNLGAATWVDGSGVATGVVSAANSLIGATGYDQVSLDGITALSNGNYVVASRNWRNGFASRSGAVTWGDGSSGSHGVVSPANSLVGSTGTDAVGAVTALTNGNYVVASPNWQNGSVAGAGAVTWADGSVGLAGAVSPANSLVGTTTNDAVGVGDAGYGGITPLADGNYLVQSPLWRNGTSLAVGAVTWADGASGMTGTISAANSLVETTAGGFGYVTDIGTALTNGNYVVASPSWSGTLHRVGAVTFGSGPTALRGPVSVANSLVGDVAEDLVGTMVVPLPNGNYVVQSVYWNNGSASVAGAVTWANGSTGLIDTVSTENSLVGTHTNDAIGDRAITAFEDSSYVVVSPDWNNGSGAITLASGNFALTGTVQAYNSVCGTAAGGGARMTYAYDATRHQLVVGRPADNIVTLFTMDQIFADRF